MADTQPAEDDHKRNQWASVDELATVALGELRYLAKGRGLASASRFGECRCLARLATLAPEGGPQAHSKVAAFTALVTRLIEQWPSPERALVEWSLAIAPDAADTLQGRRAQYALSWPACDMTIYRAQLVVYVQLAAALATDYFLREVHGVLDRKADKYTESQLSDEQLAALSENERTYLRACDEMIYAASGLGEAIYPLVGFSLESGSLHDATGHPRDRLYESLLLYVKLAGGRHQFGSTAFADWSITNETQRAIKMGIEHYQAFFGKEPTPFGVLELRHLGDLAEGPVWDPRTLARFAEDVNNDPWAARLLQTWAAFVERCSCPGVPHTTGSHEPDCKFEILLYHYREFASPLRMSRQRLLEELEQRTKSSSQQASANGE